MATMKGMRRLLMLSGDIRSLQPRASDAVARTIGSRAMSCTRLHDASIGTQSKQPGLPLIFLGVSVGVRTHLSFRGRRHGGPVSLTGAQRRASIFDDLRA